MAYLVRIINRFFIYSLVGAAWGVVVTLSFTPFDLEARGFLAFIVASAGCGGAVGIMFSFLRTLGVTKISDHGLYLMFAIAGAICGAILWSFFSSEISLPSAVVGMAIFVPFLFWIDSKAGDIDSKKSNPDA